MGLGISVLVPAARAFTPVSSSFNPGDTVQLRGTTRHLTVIGMRVDYAELPSQAVTNVAVTWLDDAGYWNKAKYPASQLVLILPIAIDPSMQPQGVAESSV